MKLVTHCYESSKSFRSLASIDCNASVLFALARCGMIAAATGRIRTVNPVALYLVFPIKETT